MRCFLLFAILAVIAFPYTVSAKNIRLHCQETGTADTDYYLDTSTNIVSYSMPGTGWKFDMKYADQGDTVKWIERWPESIFGMSGVTKILDKSTLVMKISPIDGAMGGSVTDQSHCEIVASKF
jgi:hypothetical protein